MILLCPENPSLWDKRPVTWGLIAANVFIYLLFFAAAPEMRASSYLTPNDLRTAGHLALRELRDLTPADRSKEPAWVFELDEGNAEQVAMFGSYAVRDARFLAKFGQGTINVGGGDVTAIEHLRVTLKQFRESLEDEPITRFGLSAPQSRTFAWVTYQFSHVGWFHLLSNLVFLTFVGFAIEGAFGGTCLLAVYLIGGIAGGFLFVALNPFGILPMVGASGSVSALIGFYAVAERRRNIRYFYFVFPTDKLMGFIWLPTLLIWPLYIASDLAGLLSAPEGLMSGVAYSAHVGGVFIGALGAWHWRLFENLRAGDQRGSDAENAS